MYVWVAGKEDSGFAKMSKQTGAYEKQTKSDATKRVDEPAAGQCTAFEAANDALAGSVS
jgi:hypothetical protein